MIKPITGNSLVRKSILGVMMAGAVTAGSVAAKTSPANNKSQFTEISKEAASASKAIVAPNITNVQQQNRTVHYRALDQKIRDLSENEKELSVNNKFIKDCYELLGTYGAAAYMQKTLDENLLKETTSKFKKEAAVKYKRLAQSADENKNIDGGTKLMLGLLGDQSAFKTREEIEKEAKDMDAGATRFLELLDGYINTERLVGFGNLLYDAQNSTKKPSYDEVSTAIDKTMEHLYGNNQEAMKEYHTKVNDYIKKVGTNPTVEKKATILAYKFYVLDTIAMNNAAKNCNIGHNRDFQKEYNSHFVNKARPQ